MSFQSGRIIEYVQVVTALIGVHSLIDGARNRVSWWDSEGVATCSSGLMNPIFKSRLFLLLLVICNLLRIGEEIANIEKIGNEWRALDQVVEVDFKIIHELFGGKSRILHVVILRR